MIIYLFVFFLATFFSVSAKASQRIISGEDAKIEDYPYHVSLEYRSTHICGGAMITHHHVLTAAHCEKPIDLLRIRAGTEVREQGGSLHRVLQFIKHEKYHRRPMGVSVNDIAIIKVKEPFTFDQERRPIYLRSSKVVTGMSAKVTGYGKIFNRTLSKQLQVATVFFVSKIKCNLAYWFAGGLPNGQFCAGAILTDLCQGDSGDPLAYNYGQLAGIASWDHGCAWSLSAGAYTEIAYYRDWIERHVDLEYKGWDARIEEFPYQVSIESKGTYICDGSIISENYVLTAAHCASLLADNASIFVRVGTSFRSKGGRLHTVTDFIRHEEYDTFVHDIAIVKVKEPFRYDDTCQPIKIFENNEETISGSFRYVIMTSFGLNEFADQLQGMHLRIVYKGYCKMYRINHGEGQICARGESYERSCIGNLGSPIAVDGRLAGIAMWGGECDDNTYDKAYTEVAYYSDWIGQYVQ